MRAADTLTLPSRSWSRMDGNGRPSSGNLHGIPRPLLLVLVQPSLVQGVISHRDCNCSLSRFQLSKNNSSRRVLRTSPWAGVVERSTLETGEGSQLIRKVHMTGAFCRLQLCFDNLVESQTRTKHSMGVSSQRPTLFMIFGRSLRASSGEQSRRTSPTRVLL